MGKNSVYIGVGVLAVAIIVFSYNIYKQQGNLKIPTYQQNKSVYQAPSGTQSGQQNLNLASSEEEKLVSTVSTVKNTLVDRTAYRNKLDQFAKNATTIEIINCRPTPLIAKVKENSRPYISNKDNVAHAVRLGATDLQVPANGDISVGIGKIDLYTNFSCVGGTEGLWVPAESP